MIKHKLKVTINRNALVEITYIINQKILLFIYRKHQYNDTNFIKIRYSSDQTTSMGDYYSEHCLYHTGFTGTSIYVDFDRKCGIILLTNRVHPTRDNNYIFDIRSIVHNMALLDFDDAK